MKNFKEKISWFCKEIINLYSSKKSFFSKKRIESGISFIIGEYGMIFFLCKNIEKMTTSDIVLWASLQFAVSGYMVNQIQKEKKIESINVNDNQNIEQINS